MALVISDPESCRLARKLAKLTGESVEKVVLIALRERLERVERIQLEERRAISPTCASLPELDSRSEDEIIGWDENDLPS